MGAVRRYRWIWGVALTSFGAGVAVGFNGPATVDAMREEFVDPSERYVRDLVQQYGLTTKQARQMRMVLAAELAETTEIIRAKPETLPPEILKVRRRADERIRAVLDDEQRVRFDRDTNFK